MRRAGCWPDVAAMEKDKVLSSLQTLCSRQECCSKDIYAKALRRLDGDAEAAHSVLQALVDDGYVDDRRYAAAFAREKASITGWGPVKIKFALAAKGIGAGIAAEGMAEIDGEKSLERLSRLLDAKWKTLQDDPQGKLKLIRFALSRGYDYATVKPLIERY